jgi:hypothetical protein
VHSERHDRRQARRLDHVGRDQRLLRPRERLADDELGTAVDGPADLLLEHAADRVTGGRVVRAEHVGVADVAGEHRAGVARDVGRDAQRLAVHLLEQVLLPDDPQLLAVRVVGERLDDVRAGVHELAVQLGDELPMLEHYLGDERAGLQVAAPLELEQVALGADHAPVCEPREQAPVAHRPAEATGTVRAHASRPRPARRPAR